MKYSGKYSIKRYLLERSQPRVASGAKAEATAHACYGIPFPGPAPAGAPDMKMPGGAAAEVKNVKADRTFAMEITVGASDLWGKELRKQAWGTSDTGKVEGKWPSSAGGLQATIPSHTVRELIKRFTVQNGTDPKAYASKVRDWYLAKADYLIAVVNGQCYQIPVDEVVINNHGDELAFRNYGAGARIKIVGLIPQDYAKYRVVGGQVVGQSAGIP